MMSLDLILQHYSSLEPYTNFPKEMQEHYRDFQSFKTLNLIRYVFDMMGNFIQESRDQSRGGGFIKKIILDHKGG